MKPILVHAHIYYPHLWDELKACILNIYPYSFELFVTFVEAHPKIEADIRATFPTAQILRVPNRGYDIGPFIEVLNRVNLANYSYVVKLHTKRDAPKSTATFRRLTESKWRNDLLSFIKTPEIFHSYLDVFERNPTIGMQNFYRLIVQKDIHDKKAARGFKKFLKERHLPVLSARYIGGTMFVARACIFTELQKLNLSSSDFLETKGHHSQFAHIFERFIGYCAEVKGYVIIDGVNDFSEERLLALTRWECYIRPVVRFFYQRKITQSGNIIIKILKIPIFRKCVSYESK